MESIAIEENWSIPAVYYSIKIALEKIKEVLIKNGYDINDKFKYHNLKKL